ncbi:PepSY domain-containing protein [Bacillus solimangrovi]|uniref:PepSY domain-containing protein n=1 Tax=Bacillus solimangrovi TaxID=1305675 RepID=A0A1E5LHK2_9BACI|nr:PepSY domain-containing protein [Bacillus solimangrovi]OEH93547.1 hypothetical protein BFG57_00730 [Bacillus solimangrovi]
MKRNWNKTLGVVVLSTALFTSQTAFVGAEENTDWKINSEVSSVCEVKSIGSTFIRGDIVDQLVKDENDILEFFEVNKDYFHLTADKLELKSADIDDLGMTHYTFQPKIENIPIDQSRVIVHVSKEGKIVAINGEFHPNAPTKLEQTIEISSSDAREAAWDHIGINREEADVILQISENETFESLSESSELVVYHENGTYTLTYRVELQFIEPDPANWEIWINVENGDIVKARNKLRYL